MNAKLRSICAAAVLLTISLAAHAADLPMAPVYQPAAAPAAVQQVYNWTGIYLGLNGGYTIGQATPMSLFSDNFTAFNYDASGFLGGLTAGAQIQSGRTVIGLEADIDWSNITGSGRGTILNNSVLVGTATLSSTVNSISTLRTRIGYANDNWLYFLTGGIAVTNEASTFTGATFVCGSGGLTPPCTSPTDLHLGLAAGAGVEYGITQNLSAKAEYVWVGAGAGNTLRENMLRAGLNWRFGM